MTPRKPAETAPLGAPKPHRLNRHMAAKRKAVPPEELQRRLEIGRRLVTLRGPRSKAEIARVVGVSPKTIETWEKGGSRISEAKRRKLAKALQTTDNHILTGSVSVPSPAQLNRIEDKVEEVLSRLLGYDEKLDRLLEGLFVQGLEGDVEQDEQQELETGEGDDGSGKTGSG